MRRWLLALLAALLAAVLGLNPQTAFADEDEERSGDNAAIAINTKDDSSRFRFAFDVSRVEGGALDNENVAYAYARCERCRTVAIAIQIVLGSGDPNPVAPKNVAVAVNDQCQLCVSYADARQFVVVRAEPVELSHEGKEEVREIRKHLRDLRHQEELGPAELDARIDLLMDYLKAVLETELVPADGDDDDEDEDHDEVVERAAADVAR
jgi:hypothetical protein